MVHKFQCKKASRNKTIKRDKLHNFFKARGDIPKHWKTKIHKNDFIPEKNSIEVII